MTVVDPRNPHRPAEVPPKIILSIGGTSVPGHTGSISCGALRTVVIIEPSVRIQVLVPKDVVSRAVKGVGARLRHEVLDASRGAAILR